ncbi:TniB family NTP-binding protein [Phenylobacterium sp.]|uniref:TniB family NTP-binding protein n=1 Tax=Phenylobacterium sp. TaxID=1871053 RepID=UPI00273020E1|nr:TniB family NTP-binding protein [Phenylobacterium sp.]MDP1615984.1 TniB family NTP-binding protein [Phenylobacterium sp.]MDP1986359.1 TniB family NTP-binding protein [Phenylobacterium sp.]
MTDVHQRQLTSAAREALAGDDRLTRALLAKRKHFIEHRFASAIEDRLSEALEDYPTDGDSHFLIVGDSGMGKTKLVKHFMRMHGVEWPLPEGKKEVPILMVGLVSPSPRGFLATILETLGSPYPRTGSHETLYPLVLRLLRSVGLKVLIIDEIHHIKLGRRDERERTLILIKQLGNDLGVTIIGCGTSDALRAIQLDPQLERRFEPLALGRWRDDDDGWGLLNAIEATIPLEEPSYLSDEKTARWIFAETEGLTGEIDRMIRRAAVKAIGSERPLLDLAFLKSLPWIRPSKRRKTSEDVLRRDRPQMAF